MSNKHKYNWNEPSLFPDDKLRHDTIEYRGIKTKTNKNGVTQRHAIICRTKADFIRKSQAIWGDAYDYSETVYIGSKSPVTIRCKKHNHFFTVPFAQNHYMKPHGYVKPTGCDLCTIERTGIRPPRGPHHFRTEEEKQRDKEEKNRIREERRLRAEQNKYERSAEYRMKLQQEQQAYIEKWHAKNYLEARFKERVFQMYGDQYDMALVDYQGNEKDVTLICKHHGMFEIKPRYLLVGISNGKTKKPPHGCWKCCGLPDPHEKVVLTAKDFNQRVKSIYRMKGLTFPLKRKIKPSDKITAVCKKHGEITHDAQYWLDGKGCEYCNGKYHPVDCFDNARKVHGDKYQYIGEPPRTSSGMIHYICQKHGEIEQRYDVHVRLGCGCPKCANYPNKKTPQQRCDEWIKKCIKKYGEGRYDYSRAHEDYVNNDSLVWIRCCIHDYWFQQTPDNNLRKVNGSCPICSADMVESQGEQDIRRWLEEHNIAFEKEPEIPNENPRCKRAFLKPDFWLPNYNLYIEYNGKQHYEDVKHFHRDGWTLEEQQERDRTMRWFCERHGHQLLEIAYWDYDRIDEILDEHLLKYNVNELTKHMMNP